LQKENKELQKEAKRTSDILAEQERNSKISKEKAEAQRENERLKEALRKQSEINRKEEENERKKASEAAKVVPPKAPTPAATKAPGISLIF
jgi:Skp family chaperone for outer membrane proteins